MTRKALLAVLAASAALPTSASAAEIGPQTRLTGRFPVALPGGYAIGERIPRGAALLRRRIALDENDDTVRTRFRCPGRRRVRTFAANDPGDVGFRVPDSQLPYTKRRAVTLELFASPSVEDFPARGRIYVLCRRA